MKWILFIVGAAGVLRWAYYLATAKFEYQNIFNLHDRELYDYLIAFNKHRDTCALIIPSAPACLLGIAMILGKV